MTRISTSERGKYVMVRGWQDHVFFKPEPYTEREAWEWLIGEAAYEDTKVRMKRVVLDVARGQVVHAMRFLAQRWKWSEPRVRRFLGRLREARMIELESSAESTRVTICNYDEYQFGRRARDALATHSRRREEETQESQESHLGGSSARAREGPMISADALALADDLARIAGHDLDFLPLRWVSDGPGQRCQMMLNAGWNGALMREVARAAMARKRDGAPVSIRYFEKIFERAHRPQLPIPPVQIIHENSEVVRVPAKAASHHPAASYFASKDRFRSARADLKAALASARGDDGEGSDSGGQVA